MSPIKQSYGCAIMIIKVFSHKQYCNGRTKSKISISNNKNLYVCA